MRLFVDCDDTLVLWEMSAARHDPDEGPVENDALVDALLDYHRLRPSVQIVVWSGAGTDYASRWAKRMLPSLRVVVRAKDRRTPLPGDICIDDMQFRSAAKQMLADEFIAMVASMPRDD